MTRPAPARHERASAMAVAITPFDASGAVDETAFRRHVARLASAGLGVYVAGGGSGEAYVVSGAERSQLLRAAVDEVGGKVPIRSMGVEPRSAAEMIRELEAATATGVDAVHVYSLDVGHGASPTGPELESYFDDVLKTVTLPAILSTHRSVGYVIPVELIAALSRRFEHLRGVVCSHRDLHYVAALVDTLPDHVDVHVGGVRDFLPALALGANGFLSSEANLAPRLCATVIDRFRFGDARAFVDIAGRLHRLALAIEASGGTRATKAVLEHFGLPGGQPRPPRLPADAAAVRAVVRVVEELGLPALEGW